MKKILCALVCMPLCLIGCSKKNEQVASKTENAVEAGQTAIEKNDSTVDSNPSSEKDETVLNQVYPIVEVKAGWDNNQTVLKLTVLEDNANLRVGPGTDYEKLSQVSKGDVLYAIGFDDNKSKVDGKEGYWIQVSQDISLMDSLSWIFSPLTDLNQNLSTNKMRLVDEKIDESGSATIAISRGGEEKTYEITVQLSGNLPYFVWNVNCEGFHYADAVGTFIVNKEKKVIEHLSPIGGGFDVTDFKPSDDKKYLLTGYGYSTGLHSMSVFDLTAKKNIFRGNFYNELGYSDGKVTCAAFLPTSDSEVSDFIADYPVPETGLTVRVCKYYTHDLISGEEQVIGFEYAFEE